MYFTSKCKIYLRKFMFIIELFITVKQMSKKDYNHAMFHLTRKESLSRFYWNLFTVNDSRISNKK